MKKSVTIVFAGGGTGGHVYPAIAVAEALRTNCAAIGVDLELIRMGPRDGYEALFLNVGARILPAVSGKMRQYGSLQNFIDAPKMLIGFIQALFRLYFIMPDVIFSKGGTGALPIVAAGWFYRIPVIIHESDAIPGRTNRASAGFAKEIMLSFESAAGYFKDQGKITLTGSPIRNNLKEPITTKAASKESLGFDSTLPLTVILGGSQGAKKINDFILENLQPILELTQILHQTGQANLPEVEELSRAATIDGSFKNRYKAVGYLTDEMNAALTAADAVVSRAGSGAIFEIAEFGAPSIIVPITESANDHQRANAYEFSKSGAAVVIEEANLVRGIFIEQLRRILTDNGYRENMSAAAKKFSTPSAADAIAAEILANVE